MAQVSIIAQVYLLPSAQRVLGGLAFAIPMAVATVQCRNVFHFFLLAEAKQKDIYRPLVYKHALL